MRSLSYINVFLYATWMDEIPAAMWIFDHFLCYGIYSAAFFLFSLFFPSLQMLEVRTHLRKTCANISNVKNGIWRLSHCVTALLISGKSIVCGYLKEPASYWTGTTGLLRRVLPTVINTLAPRDTGSQVLPDSSRNKGFSAEIWWRVCYNEGMSCYTSLETWHRSHTVWQPGYEGQP